MKNFKIIVFVIAFTNLVYCLSAQTAGTLTISATTSGTGSSDYGTKNVSSMWVEDSSGKFLKTLLAFASERKQYLLAWKTKTTIAGSPYNTVDAVTGATQMSHGTRTCTWNGKNRLQELVADGTYTLKMELTDNDGKKQNLASFQFVKGNAEQTLSPSTTSGFSNISIKWTPSTPAGIDETELANLYSLYPNPAKSWLFVSGNDIAEIEIFNFDGNRVLVSSSQKLNVSKLAKGIYFAKIKTERGSFVKKIIK
ncbi:MAG: hypothetical protein AUK44_04530 [Porphyromonadaceae bacterium CG2_30_38_12]|nr:MAG: hypothetical protein AUK44_04530 [Porphyromonadaceae bacterium CG2_30_38_12]